MDFRPSPLTSLPTKLTVKGYTPIQPRIERDEVRSILMAVLIENPAPSVAEVAQRFRRTRTLFSREPDFASRSLFAAANPAYGRATPPGRHTPDPSGGIARPFCAGVPLTATISPSFARILQPFNATGKALPERHPHDTVSIRTGLRNLGRRHPSPCSMRNLSMHTSLGNCATTREPSRLSTATRDRTPVPRPRPS